MRLENNVENIKVDFGLNKLNIEDYVFFLQGLCL